MIALPSRSYFKLNSIFDDGLTNESKQNGHRFNLSRAADLVGNKGFSIL